MFGFMTFKRQYTTMVKRSICVGEGENAVSYGQKFMAMGGQSLLLDK
jgi:hypothetical protein